MAFKRIVGKAVSRIFVGVFFQGGFKKKNFKNSSKIVFMHFIIFYESKK